MTRVLTIIAGEASDIEYAAALAVDLIVSGILVEFESGETWRSASASMGQDAIEVLTTPEKWYEARQAFIKVGFGIVGDQ